MLLGMSLHAFTVLHVILSLIGIGSGLIVVFGFIATRDLEPWTLLFLITTAATSLTGFLFPVQHLLPSHVIGILSLVVLAGAIFARYPMGSAGVWCRVYVVCALVALWFNVFVLVVQLFKHVPALKALAPTQTELPFSAAQLIVAAGFVVLGILSVKRFRVAER
jgi:hypothetical protein